MDTRSEARAAAEEWLLASAGDVAVPVMEAVEADGPVPQRAAGAAPGVGRFSMPIGRPAAYARPRPEPGETHRRLDRLSRVAEAPPPPRSAASLAPCASDRALAYTFHSSIC